MHPNPIYRRTTDARAFDLVRDRAFGQITLTGPGGLLASHIPVLLAPDETTLDMHGTLQPDFAPPRHTSRCAAGRHGP